MESSLRKNGIIDLTIDGADGEGFGIGRKDGLAVFTEGALPGERVRARIVKIKPRYAYARLEKVLTPSPERVAPRCPVAGRCGGCQWQHCAYPAQLAIKKQVVIDALVRIGGVAEPPVADVLGMDEPFHYRNKAQFPVVADGTAAAIGFYAPRSHRVVPVEYCPIQDPFHEPVLDTLRAYIRRHPGIGYDEAAHTGLLRHIVIKAGSGGRMVVLVVNGKALPGERALAAQLTEAGASTVLINTHTARTNVVLGERSRLLTGDGFIHAHIGPVIYRLSARSFFQVNSAQARVLYDTALALALNKNDRLGTVMDAHAGVGGVALYAARFAARVYGVELNPDAVDDAKHNAAANGLDQVQFICGSAEQVIPALLTNGGGYETEAVNADVVFLDPPRKGCEPPLLDALAAARVPAIVYISCDPATLSRDVKRLIAGGYRLDRVQPVDMFPMTGKVECVARLTREDRA